MEWKVWIGKRIFIKLKDNSVYSGKVLSVDDPKSPVQFMNMKDKYGEAVCFPVSEIKKIKEEKDGKL